MSAVRLLYILWIFRVPFLCQTVSTVLPCSESLLLSKTQHQNCQPISESGERKGSIVGYFKTKVAKKTAA